MRGVVCGSVLVSLVAFSQPSFVIHKEKNEKAKLFEEQPSEGETEQPKQGTQLTTWETCRLTLCKMRQLRQQRPDQRLLLWPRPD